MVDIDDAQVFVPDEHPMTKQAPVTKKNTKEDFVK